ncbi:MAG: hypothetical protein PHT76_11895 [Anaerostipes sp.]|nr:hypothetical protein [Anaerostipes sp.]
MKKMLEVKGFKIDDKSMRNQKFNVLISNDGTGRTISINDGITQVIIPFEPIEKYLK